MQRLTISALIATLSLLFTEAATANNIYTLDLFNTDDVMTAYITNSTYNDQQILQNTFLGNTGFVDISAYVEPGLNTITLQDYNYFQGWTYGYTFQINGVTYASGSCGTANILGCNNNAQSPDNAVVWTQDIQFTGPPTATPLPPTWMMLIGGFVGLGVFACRGTNRKAAATAAA